MASLGDDESGSIGMAWQGMGTCTSEEMLDRVLRLPEAQLRLLITHRQDVPLTAHVISVLHDLGFVWRLTGWDELDSSAPEMPAELSRVLTRVADNWTLRREMVQSTPADAPL